MPPMPPYSAARPPFITHGQSIYDSIRPWREFFDSSQVSVPFSYAEAMSRIRPNVNHFRANYALVVLVILFCSLVYHPISMIVFLILFGGWLSLYFCRGDDPLLCLGRIVDNRAVLLVLSLVTVISLALTQVGMNVLVALIIGVVLVCIHASFRGTEDLFLDETEAAEGGLISVVR